MYQFVNKNFYMIADDIMDDRYCLMEFLGLLLLIRVTNEAIKTRDIFYENGKTKFVWKRIV